MAAHTPSIHDGLRSRMATANEVTATQLIETKFGAIVRKLSDADRDRASELLDSTFKAFNEADVNNWHASRFKVFVMKLEMSDFSWPNGYDGMAPAEIWGSSHLKGVAYVVARQLMLMGFHITIKKNIDQTCLMYCTVVDPLFDESRNAEGVALPTRLGFTAKS